MTTDRITAAIDNECRADYIKYAYETWVSLTDTSDAITASDVRDDYRLMMFSKMLQPYKYFKDEWLACQKGMNELADVMRPPAAEKPVDPRPVDSEAYRNLKREALKKAQGHLDSPEFQGILDLCKRRMQGKTVEPVHGSKMVIQNVIEAGLLGRAELESFLAGKVRQG